MTIDPGELLYDGKLHLLQENFGDIGYWNSSHE